MSTRTFSLLMFRTSLWSVFIHADIEISRVVPRRELEDSVGSTGIIGSVVDYKRITHFHVIVVPKHIRYYSSTY